MEKAESGLGRSILVDVGNFGYAQIRENLLLRGTTLGQGPMLIDLSKLHLG
jgi:hypothetical protein